MAIHGKSADQIADYLLTIERDHIGLGDGAGRREACMAIAEKTIAIALQKPS